MQNTVDALMGVGLSRDEAMAEIHSGGWYESTASLYTKSNNQLIQEFLDMLQGDNTQFNVQYAWVEVKEYLDDLHNPVSSIDEAEYVRFVVYR